MLPLSEDWFIRPMFYINSPHEHLQNLFQTMLRFVVHIQACESDIQNEAAA